MRKLTKVITAQIVKLISGGCYLSDSAASVGLSKETVYRWIRIGKKALAERENGGEVKPDDIVYYNFYRAIQKAKARGVRLLLNRIKAATEKDWHAAAWILERKDPKRWGRNKLELTELYRQIKELRDEVDAIYFARTEDDSDEATEGSSE